MKFLFFITKPYSVSILKPIQTACENQHIEIAWFKASSAQTIDLSGTILETTQNVIEYSPDAVIVPGNVVPGFWPGIKVQIFHGLGEEKKGHYDITNFFDLYCTPGPFMTESFDQLQSNHGTFLVKETGWPKLDAIDPRIPIDDSKRKIGLDPSKKTILFAPTFSPKYTSAYALFQSIKQMENDDWEWLVKFHDLEKKETRNLYEKLNPEKFNLIKDHDILPWMSAADILIGDTSSVLYEFLLFDRPIITYQAKTRLDKGINILEPDELKGAITRCFLDPQEFQNNRQSYVEDLHPYQDQNSSNRVIDAIQSVLQNDELSRLKAKSPNWFRKRQIRNMVQP